MVGRFINHEGLQKNQPAMRFGHISMLPGDPIRQDNGHMQLSYLVEGHSMGGYSGAPALVDMGWGYPAGGPVKFLGVVWGHLHDPQPVIRGKEKHPDGWVVKANTGMIGVVPGWMLQRLFDEPEIVASRRMVDEELAQLPAEGGTKTD